MAFGSVNVPGGTTQGADGKFAYEVAVANGFSGTEAQWLASLKGILPGGTAGQVPVKVDGADYNTQWKTLAAEDVGAANKVHTHDDLMNTTNPTFAGFMSTLNAFYEKTAIQIGDDILECGGSVVGYRLFSGDSLVIGSNSAVGTR